MYETPGDRSHALNHSVARIKIAIRAGTNSFLQLRRAHEATKTLGNFQPGLLCKLNRRCRSSIPLVSVQTARMFVTVLDQPCTIVVERNRDWR